MAAFHVDPAATASLSESIGWHPISCLGTIIRITANVDTRACVCVCVCVCVRVVCHCAPLASPL